MAISADNSKQPHIHRPWSSRWTEPPWYLLERQQQTTNNPGSFQELSRGHALLDPILKDKKEPVGYVKVSGSLGCSGCEIVEFRILRRTSRAKSSITAMMFRRSDFGLFRDLLGRILGVDSWKEEGSKGSDWFSGITSSKFKNSPFEWAGSQEKVAGGLHGWKSCSWQNSDTEKNCTRGGSSVRVTWEK